MIVTIDGPAGAGKSSAARLLAARLGFSYLDTGAMYRAVTLAALTKKVELADDAALVELLDTLYFDMLPDGRVHLNGEDVTAAIREPSVTAASRAAADSRAVRDRLVRWQREIAQARGALITEGRDQGTIVFPHAECKFYLDADPAARARRRVAQLHSQGVTASFEDVLHQQTERDARDAARDIAPMKPAADAIVIDSSHLTLEQAVARMMSLVTSRRAKKIVSPMTPSESLRHHDS